MNLTCQDHHPFLFEILTVGDLKAQFFEHHILCTGSYSWHFGTFTVSLSLHVYTHILMRHLKNCRHYHTSFLNTSVSISYE